MSELQDRIEATGMTADEVVDDLLDDARAAVEVAERRQKQNLALVELSKGLENERDAALAQLAALRERARDVAMQACVHQPRCVPGACVGCDWERTIEDTATAAEAFVARVREDEREAIVAVIEGGRFLHDEAPAAQFAREVVAAIERDAAIRARGARRKK